MVWCFSSRLRIFHSYGDVTIDGEGLQILNYTRHSLPLSSGGSFTCHTYGDTGHPFLRSSPRTRDIRTRCRAFGSGTVTTCFSDLGLSRPGFEHPTFRLRGERSTSAPPSRPMYMKWYKSECFFCVKVYKIPMASICLVQRIGEGGSNITATKYLTPTLSMYIY